MNQKPVLVVPACEKGRGGGHLTRCMDLVCGLRALGRESRLFLKTPENNFSLINLNKNFNPEWLISETEIQTINWECIVLDRFQTPPDEFSRWSALAPVIGIDEGGGKRNNFDFLIDILPNLSRIKSNIANNFIPNFSSQRRRDGAFQRKAKNAEGIKTFKVLISFGREDTAGLGPATAKALAEKNNGNVEITLLLGRTGNLSPTSPSPTGLAEASPLLSSQRHLSGLLPCDISSSTPLNAALSLRHPTPHSLLSTPHFKIIETIPNLSERLCEYDLVITHFGLTSFEALYVGVPVLLVSPGSYHQRLAKAAGFFSLGTGKKAAAKIAGLLINKSGISLSFYEKLKNRCAALAAKYSLDRQSKKNLAETINGFSPMVSRNCPACGAVLTDPVPQAIARFPERTYRRCKKCGVIYMDRLSPPTIEYGREYFFELYQKQYGKTYIEDFPNLTAMAKRRLGIIKGIRDQGSRISDRYSDNNIAFGLTHDTSDKNPQSPFPVPHSPTLLDIGCAYGAFLAAAREEGFSSYGIDPSEDAVNYVTQTLGIPAKQGFFPTPHSPLPTPHSVITLWYVIEHFRDCVPAFSEIGKLLKPGGVMAFSTPSFSGVSGRSSLKRFLENSPADHWTVWSPASCKKVLKAAGFKMKKTVICGHHPERFPLLGKFAGSNKNLSYKLLLAVSKIFGLGDTFEVYAVKL